MKSIFYKRQELWDLFLLCAFPFFLWTLIMSFRDVGWLTERTNSWDAVGVVGYGLVFAFVETVLVFIVVALLGFLVPARWREQRVAFLGALIFSLTLWAIIDQLFAIWNLKLPNSLAQVLFSTDHPIRYYLLGLSPIIFITAALPSYLILQTEKGFQAAKDVIERISLLSMLYLFFGFIGLILVVIRNI